MTQELSFEKALEKLEKIVQELESGEIPLEEALKCFEEGVKLSRICQEKLSKAEKKIQLLMENQDGSLRKEALTEDPQPLASPRKSVKNPARKNFSEPGDLL